MYSQKELLAGLAVFRNARYSYTIATIVTLFLLTLFAFLQNGKEAMQVFTFETLGAFLKAKLFLTSLYSFNTTFSGISFFIAITSSALGGLSIAMAYEYFATRKQAIDASNIALNSLAYTFVIFGVHCATCGVVIVSAAISLFGPVFAQSVLAYSSLFACIGVGIQLVMIYSLLGKLSRPLVC
jgi:hypothetical protein